MTEKIVVNSTTQAVEIRSSGIQGAAGVSGGSQAVAYNDGVSATWGTGSDLDIQHDGTSSIIANSTGVLEINGAAGSAVVFNEDSADIDFRVESNANTNALKVDGGTGTVLINSAAANAQLYVVGTADRVQFRVDANATQTSSIVDIRNSAGATMFEIGDDTLGAFGATPVGQQATTGTTTGFTAGVGTGVNDDSTFTGNSGTAAYTIGDIVLALKNYGWLAAS